MGRPNAVAPSPDGAQLYVGSFDQDITVFARDSATGALTYRQNANVLAGGPTSLRVSPGGTLIYVTSYCSVSKIALQ